MNRVKRIFQSTIVKTTGKMLALIGVALTFATCYAPAPMPEDYEYAPADEEVYGDSLDTNTQQPAEETTEAE